MEQQETGKAQMSVKRFCLHCVEEERWLLNNQNVEILLLAVSQHYSAQT